MSKFSISFSLDVDVEDYDEAYLFQDRFLLSLRKFVTNFDEVTDINNLEVYEKDVDYDDYDGQPDEAQEWHDFDPDA